MKSLLDLLQIIYAKPRAQIDRQTDGQADKRRAHIKERDHRCLDVPINLLHYKPNEQLSNVSV